MDMEQDDLFVVFIRADSSHAESPPEKVEQLLASCSTYAEARRICRAFSSSAGECVIRYMGPAGGGD